MLSGYQVEVVGFNTEDGPVCWNCARERLGSLTVERARMGLSTGMGFFSPLTRYEAQETATESGYHCGCADEQDEDIPRAGEEPEGYEGVVDDGWFRPTKDGPEWQSHYYHEACAHYECTECGEDLSS